MSVTTIKKGSDANIAQLCINLACDVAWAGFYVQKIKNKIKIKHDRGWFHQVADKMESPKELVYINESGRFQC